MRKVVNGKHIINVGNPGNKSAAPWCYTKNPNKDGNIVKIQSILIN